MRRRNRKSNSLIKKAIDRGQNRPPHRKFAGGGRVNTNPYRGRPGVIPGKQRSLPGWNNYINTCYWDETTSWAQTFCESMGFCGESNVGEACLAPDGFLVGKHGSTCGCDGHCYANNFDGTYDYDLMALGCPELD